MYRSTYRSLRSLHWTDAVDRFIFEIEVGSDGMVKGLKVNLGETGEEHLDRLATALTTGAKLPLYELAVYDVKVDEDGGCLVRLRKALEDHVDFSPLRKVILQTYEDLDLEDVIGLLQDNFDLQVLSLSGIYNIDRKTADRLFGSQPNLKELFLEFNGDSIGNMEMDLATFMECLVKCPLLEEIRLPLDLNLELLDNIVDIVDPASSLPNSPPFPRLQRVKLFGQGPFASNLQEPSLISKVTARTFGLFGYQPELTIECSRWIYDALEMDTPQLYYHSQKICAEILERRKRYQDWIKWGTGAGQNPGRRPGWQHLSSHRGIESELERGQMFGSS